MKKVLSIALALALCLTAMMGCFVVSADGANTLAVGTANITVGDADTAVAVTLTSEGVWAATFVVVTNPAVAITGVAIDNADYSIEIEGNRVLFQTGNDNPTELTSATITLTFDTDELAAGTYSVALENIDAGNYAESHVTFETTPGSIVVAEPAPSAVAKIGDTEYATLKEALVAADVATRSNLITVEAINNITLTEDVTVSEFVTLALGTYAVNAADYKINITGNGIVKSADANLSNIMTADSAIVAKTSNGTTTYQQKVRFSLYNKTLNLASEIAMNYYFTLNVDSDVTILQKGLLQWDPEKYEAATNFEYDDACYIADLDSAGGSYWKRLGQPIAAAEMIDTYYARAFAKLSDGSYVYSDIVVYNIQDFAKDRFAIAETVNANAIKQMQIISAVLDYGTAAQKQFKYKTETLLNSCFTDEQLAKYRTTVYEDTLKTYITVDKQIENHDSSKTWYNNSVSLTGALVIKFYSSKITSLPEGSKVGMVYWTQEQYDLADTYLDPSAGTELSVVNNSNYYQGNVENIVAAQIYDVFYASYYIEDAEGNRSYSPVAACSVSSYVTTRIDNPNSAENLSNLCKQILVYGAAAVAYFG